MTFGLAVDIVVVLVLLISVAIAFLRGLIREVLTIFGIVGGLIAAYIGGPLLTPVTRGWLGVEEGAEDPKKLLDIVPYPLVADILAYGIIFIVFVIILSIFSHYIAEFVKNLGLGPLDRTLGVVFGVARGALVLGLLYLPVFYLVGDERKQEWFEGSHSYVYLEATANWIGQFIPKNTVEDLAEETEKLEGMSETRKKLEEMDILKRAPAQPAEGEDVQQDGTDRSSQDQKDGYTPEFREKMDELFEQNKDTSPGYNE